MISERRRKLLHGTGVAGVFGACLALMLRPWPGKIAEGMPQNLGDSVLITWIMHWGAHALTTNPLRYFHGNIFWPAQDTLAYSDLLLPFVPVYGTFFAITGNWPLATNLTLLVMFGLALTATYLLSRRLGSSAAGGVLAAVAFTFSGFHLSEWGHLQLHTIGLLPLAAYSTVRFLDDRTWWSAIATGAASAATLLAAVYYGLLWFVTLGILFAGYAAAKGFRPGPRFASGVIIVGVVALGLSGSALYKYADQGERRGYEDYRGLKARDLVTPAFGSYVWKSKLTFDGNPALQEHGAYPGFSVLTMATVGAATLVRRRRDDAAMPAAAHLRTGSPDARLHLGLLAIAGITGLILAVGPTALGLPMPFRVFHALVPGFSGIRVYTRLVVLFLLVIALLAGVGLDRILSDLSRRAAWSRAGGSALLVAVVLVDLSAPLGFAPFPDDPRSLAVYDRLEQRPPAAVVEIPMVDSSVLPADWAYVEAPRMVQATIDFLPRVNGYSAKAPETYQADLHTFNQFPTPQSIHRAYELRVRYVVIHVGPITDHATFSEADARAKLDGLPAAARFERAGDDWLIDLGPVRPPDD